MVSSNHLTLQLDSNITILIVLLIIYTTYIIIYLEVFKVFYNKQHRHSYNNSLVNKSSFSTTLSYINDILQHL